MITYDDSVKVATTQIAALATDRHYHFKASLVEDIRGRKSIFIIPPAGEGPATWIPVSDDQCCSVERLVNGSLGNSTTDTNTGMWRLAPDTGLPDVIRESAGAHAEIREGFVVFGGDEINISVVSRSEGDQAVFALRVIRSNEQTSSAVEIPITSALFNRLYGYFVRLREVVLSRESFSVPGGIVDVDRFQRAGSSKLVKGVETHLPGAVMHAHFDHKDAWLTFCSAVPSDVAREVYDKRYSPEALAIYGLPKE